MQAAPRCTCSTALSFLLRFVVPPLSKPPERNVRALANDVVGLITKCNPSEMSVQVYGYLARRR
jgi:hypothetical protein